MATIEVIVSGLIILSPMTPNPENTRQFDAVKAFMLETPQGTFAEHEPQLLIPVKYVADTGGLPSYCSILGSIVKCDVKGKDLELVGFAAGRVSLAGASDLCTPSNDWGDFCWVLPMNHVPFSHQGEVRGLKLQLAAERATSSFLFQGASGLSSAHCSVISYLAFLQLSVYRQNVAEHARFSVMADEPALIIHDGQANGTMVKLKEAENRIEMAYANLATRNRSGGHFARYFRLLGYRFAGGLTPRIRKVKEATKELPEGHPSLLPTWFQGFGCHMDMAETQVRNGLLAAPTGSLCPLIRADPE